MIRRARVETPFEAAAGERVPQQGGNLFAWGTLAVVMTRTIELDDELADRMETHLEDDETIEEFIEELVAIYEQEGRFLQEGA